MPDTAVTSPDPPSRSGPARHALRIASIVAAVIVTVLAAAPPDAAIEPFRAAMPVPVRSAAGGEVALAAVDRGPPGNGPEAGARIGSAPSQPQPPTPPQPRPPTPPAEPGGTGPAAPPDDGPPSGAPVPPPVRPPGAGVRAPGADYAWPLVPAPGVAQPFRAPSFRFGRGHRGADLAGTAGQAVLAAREGRVVFAGRVAGRPVVSVDHPDGLRTTYEPVLATVRPGDRLTVGDPLGVLVAGHAGCAVACLHWGVRRGKVDYLDPLVLVRPPRLRLLPWDGA